MAEPGPDPDGSGKVMTVENQRRLPVRRLGPTGIAP